MKIEELERKELRGRIMNVKYRELHEKAKNIWADKVGMENWSTLKCLWFIIFEGGFNRIDCAMEVKNIQMRLLEKEVEEAIESLELNKKEVKER